MMAGRRPLTAAEAWQSWQVDAELSGGHLPSETIGFVSALEDIADERSSRQGAPWPLGVVPADCEPKWRTRLNRWLGR
jgi:hypothetical protein